jgi:hypothetical protein
MTPTSRPLRALAVALGGWTMMRVIVLWPVSSNAVEARSIDDARMRPALPVVTMPLDDDVPMFAERPLSRHSNTALAQAHRTALVRTMAGLPAAPETTAPDPPRDVTTRSAPDALVEARTAIAPGLPTATPRNRFSGSAWSLMRGDGAPSLASGGQLGGSQIGVRFFYTPGPDVLAITARISAPLSQPLGREAAVGIALRGRNVGLIAEQRFSLDKGGRNAPAVFAYGGVSDVVLPAGLKLDGYAQAGVVGVKAPAAFIDGAIRVERTVLKTNKSNLAIGAGAWGGAQPGVSRLDVGPQVVAHLSVADTSLRVSAEWRQRVAGTAAPASGPSVTVGFDF